MLGCIVVNSRTGDGVVDFINRIVNCTFYGNATTRPVGVSSCKDGAFVRNSVVLGNNANTVNSFDGGNNIARNYDPADTKGDLVAAAFGDYRPVAGGDVADAGDAAALVAFQNETGIPNDLRDYDLFGQPRVRADGKVAADAVATPIVPQGGALKARLGTDVRFNGVQLKAGEAVWADVWPKQVYLTRPGNDLVCFEIAESNTVATANAVIKSYQYPDREDGFWLTYPATEEPNLQTSLTTPKSAVHNPVRDGGRQRRASLQDDSGGRGRRLGQPGHPHPGGAGRLWRYTGGGETGHLRGKRLRRRSCDRLDSGRQFALYPLGRRRGTDRYPGRLGRHGNGHW